MRQLLTFRTVLKRSLTQPAYYKDILRASFSFSLKYLALLVFLTIFIQIAALGIQGALYLPKLPDALTRFQAQIKPLFPDDLIVTVQNGVLSVNQPTPYFIDIPELSSEFGVDHAVTIDPDAHVEDFMTSSTIMLVTDTEVVYGDYSTTSNGQYRVIPLTPDGSDGVLDRNAYDSFLVIVKQISDQIVQYAPLSLVVFVVFVPIIITTTYLIWLMFYLIVLTGILAIVAKSMKQNIPFWKLYQMGMHGLTIPILATFLLSMLGSPVPLLFTSSFLLWMVIVISKMEKS